MRYILAKSLAAAVVSLSRSVEAVPVVDEAEEAVNIYDVFPVEVVIAKPTTVEIFCAENGVYPIDEDTAFTVTNAPTTIATQITRFSTFQTQTTM